MKKKILILSTWIIAADPKELLVFRPIVQGMTLSHMGLACFTMLTAPTLDLIKSNFIALSIVYLLLSVSYALSSKQKEKTIISALVIWIALYGFYYISAYTSIQRDLKAKILSLDSWYKLCVVRIICSIPLPLIIFLKLRPVANNIWSFVGYVSLLVGCIAIFFCLYIWAIEIFISLIHKGLFSLVNLYKVDKFARVCLKTCGLCLTMLILLLSLLAQDDKTRFMIILFYDILFASFASFYGFGPFNLRNCFSLISFYVAFSRFINCIDRKMHFIEVVSQIGFVAISFIEWCFFRRKLLYFALALVLLIDIVVSLIIQKEEDILQG